MIERETRTERMSVNLVPSVMQRLDAYREPRRWTRSTAAAVLIERGLEAAEEEDQKGRSH
ncbi:MAG TPA: hypothetical protein VLM11_00685 [Streptosporangiaceae bacterium]|nr:hypothetical protein [Streptosporangiaceae bacterium]